MLFYNAGSTCEGSSGESCSIQNEQPTEGKHKPIEIYSFIDPLCPDCWGLEPITKKLTIEYGQYFTLRHFIAGKLDVVNNNQKSKRKTIADHWERSASLSGMSCDGDALYRNPPPSSYATSIAVKAAELQGKSAGIRYLRKIREMLFLEKQNINDEDVLIQCAESAELDVAEFKKDMQSKSAIKALQCDMRITSEMDVDALPTLVILNVDVEQEGIKITGRYPYDVYVQILTDMLGEKPLPKSPPTMGDFMKKYKFIATKELSVVYNMSVSDIEREMKKLKLKQIVERVPVKYGTFWRYIDEKAR